jgi:hypothetical protein
MTGVTEYVQWMLTCSEPRDQRSPERKVTQISELKAQRARRAVLVITAMWHVALALTLLQAALCTAGKQALGARRIYQATNGHPTNALAGPLFCSDWHHVGII